MQHHHLGIQRDSSPLLPPTAWNDLKGFYGDGCAWMLWDDKDAWRIRKSVEGEFYSTLLRRHNVGSVIDVSAASGFHVIHLAQAGFRVAATDGFEGFVLAGLKNVKEAHLSIPFETALWSDLPRVSTNLGRFDAAVCLGSSLHHTDQVGIAELFRNTHTLLNAGGIFIVEQRNYERLFAERPQVMDHPCGWSYTMEYPDERTLMFHLRDSVRGLNTSTISTVTFEDELLSIASRSGYALVERHYDYAKQAARDKSWWIQYVFLQIV